MRVLAYICLFAALTLGVGKINYTTEAQEIAPVEPKIAVRTKTLPQLVQTYAQIYHVDGGVMYNVIKCESSFNPDAIGDHGTSFGLSQIHLPAHPEVTKEQATDPIFAIEFMAKEMSEGRAWQWSCYKMLY